MVPRLGDVIYWAASVLAALVILLAAYAAFFGTEWRLPLDATLAAVALACGLSGGRVGTCWRVVDMSKKRLKSDDAIIAARHGAFGSDEGRAQLVHRWLSGESDKEIGGSLGYPRKRGAPIRAAS